MKNDIPELDKYYNILFPYAYNILGAIDEAKDAIQEVLTKYLTSGHEVKNEKGYLITSVINQSITLKNRGKKTIPTPVQLPEPIATEKSDTDIHLKDIISYSLFILLEQLNAKERAVFVLKEGFNYTHEEIAQVISSTAVHSRKLLSRARLKLSGSKKNDIRLSKREVNAYLDSYISAIRNRDVKKLEQLFASDIKVLADGGKKINVLSAYTDGTQACIALLFEVFVKFQMHQKIKFTEVNHQPAILFFDDKKLASCQVFSIDQNRKIYTISNVVAPEKLRHIT